MICTAGFAFADPGFASSARVARQIIQDAPHRLERSIDRDFGLQRLHTGIPSGPGVWFAQRHEAFA
jgi:hypothetical protein